MFGTCEKCSSEVGYFKLTDGICDSCMNSNKTGKIKRLSNSMPILTWIFPILIVFQLAFPWIFQGIFLTSPEVATAVGVPDIKYQFIFRIILLIVLLIPLAIIFVVRFFIIRRQLNIILAWVVLILLFMPSFVILSMLLKSSFFNFNTMIFLIVAFKTLRLENIITSSEANRNG